VAERDRLFFDRDCLRFCGWACLPEAWASRPGWLSDASIVRCHRMNDNRARLTRVLGPSAGNRIGVSGKLVYFAARTGPFTLHNAALPFAITYVYRLPHKCHHHVHYCHRPIMRLPDPSRVVHHCGTETTQTAVCRTGWSWVTHGTARFSKLKPPPNFTRSTFFFRTKNIFPPITLFPSYRVVGGEIFFFFCHWRLKIFQIQIRLGIWFNA